MAMCTTKRSGVLRPKRAYPTRSDARAAALRVNKEFDESYIEYLCFCGKYHLGHPPRRMYARYSETEMLELGERVVNHNLRENHHNESHATSFVTGVARHAEATRLYGDTRKTKRVKPFSVRDFMKSWRASTDPRGRGWFECPVNKPF